MARVPGFHPVYDMLIDLSSIEMASRTNLLLWDRQPLQYPGSIQSRLLHVVENELLNNQDLQQALTRRVMVLLDLYVDIQYLDGVGDRDSDFFEDREEANPPAPHSFHYQLWPFLEVQGNFAGDKSLFSQWRQTMRETRFEPTLQANDRNYRITALRSLLIRVYEYEAHTRVGADLQHSGIPNQRKVATLLDGLSYVHFPLTNPPHYCADFLLKYLGHQFAGKNDCDHRGTLSLTEATVFLKNQEIKINNFHPTLLRRACSLHEDGPLTLDELYLIAQHKGAFCDNARHYVKNWSLGFYGELWEEEDGQIVKRTAFQDPYLIQCDYQAECVIRMIDNVHHIYYRNPVQREKKTYTCVFCSAQMPLQLKKSHLLVCDRVRKTPMILGTVDDSTTPCTPITMYPNESYETFSKRYTTTLVGEMYKAWNQKKNIFLSGPAGTGKTYGFRQFMNLLVKDNHLTVDQILICSATGAASANAGGETLHSTFRIQVVSKLHFVVEDLLNSWMSNRIPHSIPDQLKTYKIIFIDEVSQVHQTILQAIDWILKKVHNSDQPFGGIPMIFAGDFLQRPMYQHQHFLFYSQLFHQNLQVIPFTFPHRFYINSTKDNWQRRQTWAIALDELRHGVWNPISLAKTGVLVLYPEEVALFQKNTHQISLTLTKKKAHQLHQQHLAKQTEDITELVSKNYIVTDRPLTVPTCTSCSIPTTFTSTMIQKMFTKIHHKEAKPWPKNTTTYWYTPTSRDKMYAKYFKYHKGETKTNTFATYVFHNHYWNPINSENDPVLRLIKGCHVLLRRNQTRLQLQWRELPTDPWVNTTLEDIEDKLTASETIFVKAHINNGIMMKVQDFIDEDHVRLQHFQSQDPRWAWCCTREWRCNFIRKKDASNTFITEYIVQHHFPFITGQAINIDKVQGLTLQEVFFHLEMQSTFIMHHAFYAAMSRVINPETCYLVISKPNDEVAFKNKTHIRNAENQKKRHAYVFQWALGQLVQQRERKTPYIPFQVLPSCIAAMKAYDQGLIPTEEQLTSQLPFEEVTAVQRGLVQEMYPKFTTFKKKTNDIQEEYHTWSNALILYDFEIAGKEVHGLRNRSEPYAVEVVLILRQRVIDITHHPEFEQWLAEFQDMVYIEQHSKAIRIVKTEDHHQVDLVFLDLLATACCWYKHIATQEARTRKRGQNTSSRLPPLSKRGWILSGYNADRFDIYFLFQAISKSRYQDKGFCVPKITPSSDGITQVQLQMKTNGREMTVLSTFDLFHVSGGLMSLDTFYKQFVINKDYMQEQNGIFLPYEDDRHIPNYLTNREQEDPLLQHWITMGIFGHDPKTYISMNEEELEALQMESSGKGIFPHRRLRLYGYQEIHPRNCVDLSADDFFPRDVKIFQEILSKKPQYFDDYPMFSKMLTYLHKDLCVLLVCLRAFDRLVIEQLGLSTTHFNTTCQLTTYGWKLSLPPSMILKTETTKDGKEIQTLDLPLSTDVDQKFIDRSIQGGKSLPRSFVYQSADPNTDWVVVADIVSQYASVMMGFELPHGNQIRTANRTVMRQVNQLLQHVLNTKNPTLLFRENDIFPYHFIAKVTVKMPSHLLEPMVGCRLESEKYSLSWRNPPEGEVIHVTNVDLALMIAQGGLVQNIVEVMYWENRSPFLRPYIHQHYLNKTKYKKEGKKARSNFSKLMQNAAYGSLGKRSYDNVIDYALQTPEALMESFKKIKGEHNLGSIKMMHFHRDNNCFTVVGESCRLPYEYHSSPRYLLSFVLSFSRILLARNIFAAQQGPTSPLAISTDFHVIKHLTIQDGDTDSLYMPLALWKNILLHDQQNFTPKQINTISTSNCNNFVNCESAFPLVGYDLSHDNGFRSTDELWEDFVNAGLLPKTLYDYRCAPRVVERYGSLPKLRALKILLPPQIREGETVEAWKQRVILSDARIQCPAVNVCRHSTEDKQCTDAWRIKYKVTAKGIPRSGKVCLVRETTVNGKREFDVVNPHKPDIVIAKLDDFKKDESRWENYGADLYNFLVMKTATMYTNYFLYSYKKDSLKRISFNINGKQRSQGLETGDIIYVDLFRSTIVRHADCRPIIASIENNWWMKNFDLDQAEYVTVPHHYVL